MSRKYVKQKKEIICQLLCFYPVCARYSSDILSKYPCRELTSTDSLFIPSEVLIKIHTIYATETSLGEMNLESLEILN